MTMFSAALLAEYGTCAAKLEASVKSSSPRPLVRDMTFLVRPDSRSGMNALMAWIVPTTFVEN